MQDENLLQQEINGSEDDVLPLPRHVAQVFEGREVVPHLPEDVRQEDEERRGRPEKGPPRAQGAALPGQEDPGGECCAEKGRRVLVQEAEPQEDAGGDPARSAGSRSLTSEGQKHRVDGPHPEQRLERVHRQKAVDAEEDGCREDRQGRHPLCVPAAAEPPRQEPRQDDERGTRQRGKDAQGGQRPAEEQRDLRPQADHRGVVDVAPVEVPGAVEEVELVAEVAVAVRERRVDDELRRREQADHDPGGPRSAAGRPDASGSASGRSAAHAGGCPCFSISRWNRGWPWSGAQVGSSLSMPTEVPAGMTRSFSRRSIAASASPTIV